MIRKLKQKIRETSKTADSETNMGQDSETKIRKLKPQDSETQTADSETKIRKLT